MSKNVIKKTPFQFSNNGFIYTSNSKNIEKMITIRTNNHMYWYKSCEKKKNYFYDSRAY